MYFYFFLKRDLLFFVCMSIVICYGPTADESDIVYHNITYQVMHIATEDFHYNLKFSPLMMILPYS